MTQDTPVDPRLNHRDYSMEDQALCTEIGAIMERFWGDRWHDNLFLNFQSIGDNVIECRVMDYKEQSPEKLVHVKHPSRAVRSNTHNDEAIEPPAGFTDAMFEAIRRHSKFPVGSATTKCALTYLPKALRSNIRSAVPFESGEFLISMGPALHARRSRTDGDLPTR